MLGGLDGNGGMALREMVRGLKDAAKKVGDVAGGGQREIRQRIVACERAPK